MAQAKTALADSMDVDVETQSSRPEEEEDNAPIRKLVLCSEEDLEGTTRALRCLELAHRTRVQLSSRGFCEYVVVMSIASPRLPSR